MSHGEVDGYCKFCRMVTQAYIPHECNPAICHGCNAVGTVDGKTCKKCNGSGNPLRPSSPPNEDNPIGAIT